ncbi:MAG: hypothetical protein KAX77_01255 [Xanthomonadales bacterium]|nr:hypothetical protein [Xanthomonadales bacterium]
MSASALLPFVIAAQKAINDLATALGVTDTSNPYGCTDDPYTSPLGPNGEWTPPSAMRLAAAAAAKYPDGFHTELEPDGRGNAVRRKVWWVDRILYTPMRARPDLTDEQRASLVAADERTWHLGMIANSGNLCGIASDPKGPNGTGPCLFTTGPVYGNGQVDRFWTELRAWYAYNLDVTVE